MVFIKKKYEKKEYKKKKIQAKRAIGNEENDKMPLATTATATHELADMCFTVILLHTRTSIITTQQQW